MMMTGEQAFRSDETKFGVHDRRMYGQWKNLPIGLRRWWKNRAEMAQDDLVLDWNAVRAAVRRP